MGPAAGLNERTGVHDGVLVHPQRVVDVDLAEIELRVECGRQRDRRRHERRVVVARRETFRDDDVADPHRAEQRSEPVGLAVGGERHVLRDQLRAVGRSAGPQVGDIRSAVVGGCVGDAVAELPARERKDARLPEPQHAERAPLRVVAHERERRSEVAVRRAPPATPGSDQRGDDADRERRRRRRARRAGANRTGTRAGRPRRP